MVFATCQSSPEIAKAFELGRVPAFDLVIADDAHRGAGPVSSAFATVLDATAIKARRRLFMTATHGTSLAESCGKPKRPTLEVASMDNEAASGPVFHRLAFAEAIKCELLTDYQVVVVGADDATYLDRAHATSRALQGNLTSIRQRRLEELSAAHGRSPWGWK